METLFALFCPSLAPQGLYVVVPTTTKWQWKPSLPTPTTTTTTTKWQWKPSLLFPSSVCTLLSSLKSSKSPAPPPPPPHGNGNPLCPLFPSVRPPPPLCRSHHCGCKRSGIHLMSTSSFSKSAVPTTQWQWKPSCPSLLFSSPQRALSSAP